MLIVLHLLTKECDVMLNTGLMVKETRVCVLTYGSGTVNSLMFARDLFGEFREPF